MIIIIGNLNSKYMKKRNLNYHFKRNLNYHLILKSFSELHQLLDYTILAVRS
jgi:hypothetical protein